MQTLMVTHHSHVLLRSTLQQYELSTVLRISLCIVYSNRLTTAAETGWTVQD